MGGAVGGISRTSGRSIARGHSYTQRLEGFPVERDPMPRAIRCDGMSVDDPQRIVVKTGLIAGDKTEILKGLKEGDEILAKKP